MTLFKTILSVEYKGVYADDKVTVDNLRSALIQTRHTQNINTLVKYNSFMDIMLEEAASVGDDKLAGYIIDTMANIDLAANVKWEYAVKNVKKKWSGNRGQYVVVYKGYVFPLYTL